MTKIKKNIAISDSGFVFDPMSGESFSLNPIGLEIIQLIKNVQSFDEVSRVILAKYAVDAETFDRNFCDFISMLKQFNLLEPEGNG